MSSHWRIMETIGTIKEIWRYPVSSLGGELCREAIVGSSGVHGDRQYALFDPVSGAVAAPEKEPRWRPALFLSSAIDADGPKIGFPDGSWLYLTDPGLRKMLGGHFGFDVAVGRYGGTDGRTASLPQVSNRYSLAPIHLVTTASLQELETIVPTSQIDRRRFRPNILVEVQSETGFAEMRWIGKTVHLDGLVTKITEPAKRCGMTLVAQPGLDEQAEILRSIVRHASRSLGVYCEVKEPARVRVGASVSRSALTKPA
ncbi:MOSC domain-containing protein [Neorhizobium sp. JUb45]|uniref:MOSC domain-containing protein n=1 Tax=Neorhizobium sp. JUb45 TaxID=2485113 RepID=UPI00104E6CDF|nr:MOSC domain-containing protein [Neorhizobium sp. JUb45]TCR00424.1 hypothetical protein EDF70_10637 [Neorhizobium sp. JUb45]